MVRSEGSDGTGGAEGVGVDGGGPAVTRRQVVRSIAGAAILSGAAPLLAACGSSDSGGSDGSGKAIKIGALLSMTGTFANLGRDQQRGLELWLEEHGGKVGGLPATLVIEDDTGQPSVGLQKAQRLLSAEKVDVTVGVIGSDIALALRDLYDSRKKLLIVTNASTDVLTTEKFSDYIFRTSYTSFENGYASGSWAASKVGKRGIAVISDYAAGHEILGSFQQAIQDGGGEVVGVVAAPLGTTDWAPHLATLRKDADFVWAQCAGNDAVSLVKQYKQFGLDEDKPLIGIVSLTTAESLPAEGAAAIGVRTTSNYSADLENPANDAFVKAFRTAYNAEPSPYAVFAWDAMAMLDKAVAATGQSTEAEKLIPALASTKLDSPRGPVSFDETHNPTQRLYVLEVQRSGGKLVNVPQAIAAEMSPTKLISGYAPLP